jgi:oligopeptide transport system substrate-binding protein
VSRALEKVGFSVKVNAYRFEDYLRRLNSGRSQLFRLGWIAEYPVADEFLSSLFGSDAPDNHSNFASQRVDRLLERAHAEESATRRLHLYRRAEDEILQRAPVIPIGSFVSHWVAKPRVEGIEFDVMGGFDAAGISLAEE